MTFPSLKVFSSIVCVLLLLPVSPCSAQQSPPVFVPGATPPDGSMQAGGRATPQSGIKIVVLEGRLGVNRLKEGVFVAPVVEIRDSNDRPLEGAQVTFTLPGGSGAGAAFSDGSLVKTFTSNAQGQAMAEGYAPNNVEGKFEVKVNAVYETQKTQVLIQQANSFQTQLEADRKKATAWRKWLWIGGAAAGGGIAAAILLNRGGSSSPGVITVTPGPPVFGGR
jgi:hypothetical protein